MARQRMIKPEFFESESLSECSMAARLCFIGLWVMGDDNGNQKLNLKRMKRQIFPDDEMSLDSFQELLSELEAVGCIRIYSVDDEPYLNVTNFSVYQTVKNPSKTNIPSPDEKIAKTSSFFCGKKEALTHDLPSTNSQEVSTTANTENLVENSVENSNYGRTNSQGVSPNPVLTLNKERSKEDIGVTYITPISSTNSEKNSEEGSGKRCSLCGSQVMSTPSKKTYACPVCGLVKAEAVVA